MKQLPARIIRIILAAALLTGHVGIVRAQSIRTASVYSDRPQSGSQGATSTNRMIVKFRDGGGNMQPADVDRQTQRLSAVTGVALEYIRDMSGGAHVLQLPGYVSFDEARAMSKRLMALPDVEYAEPDQIFQPTLTPNDPQYADQWHYHGEWGINLPAAWDLTKGSANIVVAVIDTGITHHADLRANIVPGYDFISDLMTANDGNGRDGDPADPGDWVDTDNCENGSPPHDSSWHGTHVAGTIGATSNNGVGVAGINWNAKILPVRVLGRCGGYLSDLVDAIRWSAGLPVPGAPANPNRAKVINMSLGGPEPCESSLQNAINQVIAAGTVVVVAAGNELADAETSAPGSCAGVITVAATDETGDMALYSNYGTAVEISAPGGGLFTGVLSTSNTGTTVPASDTYVYNSGTSMAAPHVSGVVSLILARNPHLTPGQVLAILQSTARPFLDNGLCALFFPCGAGIVDAGAAVAAVPSQSFADVATSHWAWSFVEQLYRAGITGGCGVNPLRYCPDATVTRAEMAVFLLRGIHSSSYLPPAVGGSTGFADVPVGYWSAAWIKQLASEGITGGCGSGNFCPEAPVTRAQMAVFLLRSKHGAAYTPPPVGSSTGFGDVPPGHWAAAWIKQLVTEGIATGCITGSYCPEGPVTRAQMAVFLVRTFQLP